MERERRSKKKKRRRRRRRRRRREREREKKTMRVAWFASHFLSSLYLHVYLDRSRNSHTHSHPHHHSRQTHTSLKACVSARLCSFTSLYPLFPSCSVCLIVRFLVSIDANAPDAHAVILSPLQRRTRVPMVIKHSGS